jgi:hypothetical protein
MSHPAQTSFALGAAVRGLLGCGLRLPDATCVIYSFDKMCPRKRMEDVLHQLAETMTLLASHKLVPCRLTWTFEQGQIFLISRADGALLALATQPNTEAAENVDQLAEEFFPLAPDD